MTDLTKRLGGKTFLEKRAKSSIRWIKRSFKVHNNEGSAAYFSQIKGWSFAYPETTGYLIPTMHRYAQKFEDQKLIDLIRSQIDFLITSQNEDGSFPRFFHEASDPLVFDTAQILLGLNYAYQSEDLKSDAIHTAIEKAYLWLVERLGPFGSFTSNNFIEGYNPSYYTRILWPMHESNLILGDDANDKKLEQSLDFFFGLKNENLSFKDWSFEPNNAALTHSIVYTLRGLYETALLMKNESLIDSVKESTSKLITEIQDNNWQIAASYDQDWSGNYSFICSSGNAQLFILILKLFGPEAFDIKLYESLMGPLIKAQRKKIKQPGLGAVPSSIPIWGKYQRFRYTNWTQKFYLDALMDLLDLD